MGNNLVKSRLASPLPWSYPFFRFVGQELIKLIPTCIHNAFYKIGAFYPFGNIKIFYANILIVIDYFFRLFVTKVPPLVTDIFIYRRDDLTDFASFFSTFGEFREFFLFLSKTQLFRVIETRIYDFFPIRQCRKDELFSHFISTKKNLKSFV